MARYIDADALLKKIYPLDLVDKRLYSINAKAVYEAICATPTADVVPKSEVAREIFAEIYEDCFNQFGYLDYDALDKLKKKYTEGETDGNKTDTEI